MKIKLFHNTSSKSFSNGSEKVSWSFIWLSSENISFWSNWFSISFMRELIFSESLASKVVISISFCFLFLYNSIKTVIATSTTQLTATAAITKTNSSSLHFTRQTFLYWRRMKNLKRQISLWKWNETKKATLLFKQESYWACKWRRMPKNTWIN